MTISSEIERIKNNIKQAYTSCSSKGATIPELQNSSNLATCINSIEKIEEKPAPLPTETISITENGTYDVINYAKANVQVESQATSKYSIPLELTDTKILQKPSKPYEFSAGEAIKVNNKTFAHCFKNDTGIKSASFPNVEIIGEQAFLNAFEGATSLEAINFPKLIEAKYESLNSAFRGGTKIKKADFPMLKHARQLSFQFAFSDDRSLTEVNFPNLEIIGENALNCAFENCYYINKIDFSKLKSLDACGLYSTFENCTKITEVTFPELSVLNSSALAYTFGACSSLKHVYFPALTEETFTSIPDVQTIFEGMLARVTGCTVHFPADIKEVVKPYSEIAEGFDGTNTIVLFDLKGLTLNFEILNSTDYSIYLSGEKVGNSGIYNTKNKGYCVIDNTNNVAHVGYIDNIQKDSTLNLNLDFAQPKKKVSITTKIENISVQFYIDGTPIPAKTDDNLNYYIEVIGDHAIVDYCIEKENYKTEEGSIEYSGESISREIIIYSGNKTPFTRPNLKANGLIGGKEFACNVPKVYSLSYDAFQAFDGDFSTFWMQDNVGPEGNNILYFYNPNLLYLTKLTCSYYSSYSARRIIIEASNDNIKYVQIKKVENRYSTSKEEIPFTDSKGYKYYKLTFTPYYRDTELSELAIEGSELIINKGIKYRVKTNTPDTKAYLNDVELTSILSDMKYVQLKPEQILDSNLFKVVENGQVVYQEKVDFNNVDNNNCYEIDVDLTQNCTLSITSKYEISSVDYIVNGIPSDITATQISVPKGSNVSYTIHFADAKYNENAGSLRLQADKTIDVIAKIITIDLHPHEFNSAWQKATIQNPTSYDMYESTNKGKGSSFSTMKVRFIGYSTFTCYINSHAESTYDYTWASPIDDEDADREFVSTSNFQYPPDVFSEQNYKTVTYDNLDPNVEHFFYVVYRKDSSGNSNSDTGYLIINSKQ